jgi:N utilization substance protein B
MISRRLLRIKTLKLLYSHARSASESIVIESIEKELQTSIQKLYDLFYFILSSATYVADYAEERINIGLQKFRPTDKEAHPNRRFVENALIGLLRRNHPLAQYCKKHSLSWTRDTTKSIRDIYTNMIERDYYKTYMDNPEKPSFHNDRQFLQRFFRYEFEGNEPLETMLEEQSIWWSADDLGYVLSLIIRTLAEFKPEQPDDTPLSRAQRSRSDKDFARRLLRRTLTHYREYWNIAVPFLKNWEADRVATMDMMLIVQGFAEAVEFPEMPIKITLNEHVELAKYYSTHNSHTFVNGVLDRMIKQGLADGLIVKKGIART